MNFMVCFRAVAAMSAAFFMQVISAGSLEERICSTMFEAGLILRFRCFLRALKSAMVVEVSTASFWGDFSFFRSLLIVCGMGSVRWMILQRRHWFFACSVYLLSVRR